MFTFISYYIIFGLLNYFSCRLLINNFGYYGRDEKSVDRGIIIISCFGFFGAAFCVLAFSYGFLCGLKDHLKK